jgi:DNA-directed RNA polymerase specialized sigma24 family protein
MRNATKRPIAEWSETDWLTQLDKLACQLTPCADDAADLAHTCLCAFHDRFGCYPWQHPNPPSAWRWCCQKVHSLWVDTHRQAQCHPQLSWEALPEGVVCGAIAEIGEGDVDGEAFLASLPKRLREVLELRLAGYSWEEAARRLGVQASTLRGYLPELRAKFGAFFGYDPSKRGF